MDPKLNCIDWKITKVMGNQHYQAEEIEKQISKGGAFEWWEQPFGYEQICFRKKREEEEEDEVGRMSVECSE